ncbi:MAG: hypothetical protein FWF59_11010 [Turicibacter sp.]|nr:hypothetical protein [Turicibacter sp.]
MVKKNKVFCLNFKKMDINDVLSKKIFTYTLFLMLFLTTSTFNWSQRFQEGVRLLQFIRIYLSFLIIIFSLLVKRFRLNECVIYSIIVMFFLLHSFFREYRWENFYFLSIALLVKDQKVEWILDRIFKVFSLNFLSILILHFLGIISPVTVMRANGTLRSSLGFWHPNTTGGMILIIFIVYLLKKKNKPSFLVLSSFVLIFFLLNIFLDSRTGLIGIILIIFGIIFLRISEKLTPSSPLLKPTFQSRLIFILPFLFLFSSLFISLLFTRESIFFLHLNRLLTGRIDLGHFYLNEYPITLWGIPIFENAGDQNSINQIGFRFLDNAFLFSLLSLGILFTFLRIILIYLISKYLLLRGHKYIIVILIGFLFFGFMERLIWIPAFNIFFILGGLLLDRSNAIQKEVHS